MMADSLWDRHAQWWIDGFTGGADPEYEEQIIPLQSQNSAERVASLMSAAGTGRWPGPWRLPGVL